MEAWYWGEWLLTEGRNESLHVRGNEGIVLEGMCWFVMNEGIDAWD